MNYRLIHADVLDGLRSLPDESIQCVVTSPPYWGLRDYGIEGQLGLERTPDEYVASMVGVFAEVRRVLRNDGVLWLNIGDSYAGSSMSGDGESSSTLVGTHHTEREGARFDSPPRITPGIKPKDLVGIPWRVAFALQADGWYLRSDIIWSKPNPMPESVTDRPTKAHEYLFLLTKSARYYYDADAIKEPNASSSAGWGETSQRSHGDSEVSQRRAPGGLWRVGSVTNGRNKRTVWTIATSPFPEAHFATFPPDLVEPCILAGSKVGDTILDPFNGSGTTGVVALSHQRNYIGIDLNADYLAMARRRLKNVAPMFANEVTVLG